MWRLLPGRTIAFGALVATAVVSASCADAAPAATSATAATARPVTIRLGRVVLIVKMLLVDWLMA